MSPFGFGRKTRNVEPRRHRSAGRRFVPRLEALEDRFLPSVTTAGIPAAGAAKGLAQSLVGMNVTISNVQFTGTVGVTTASAGTVKDPGGTTLGLPNVVALGSGAIGGLVASGSLDADEGPFPGVPANRAFGTVLGLPGDPQLNALANVTPAHAFDATVLQFDFIPKGNLLTFQYIFGSNEYNGAAAAANNDSFGIFVNNQVASLVPGTSTPVGVGSVNLNTNSQFFIDNLDDDFNEVSPRQISLGGLTTLFTAVVPVNSGVVNHIKFAVQDTGDPFGDSFVFIRPGSLSAGSRRAFKPFRYVFHEDTQTYQGNATVLNAFVVPLPGPLAIAFSNIPSNATLINATGSTLAPDGVTVLPVIAIPGISVLNPYVAARAQVVFSNPPPPVFLSTFFEGYLISILSGPAAQPFQ